MSNKFFTQLDKGFKDQFDVMVKKAKHIVISSHYSPDDDSISSVLAIYYYLTTSVGIQSSKVKIIYKGKKDSRWDYFRNYDKVLFVPDFSNDLKDVDLLIILDCQGPSRVSNGEELPFAGEIIVIDHHPKPDENINLQLVAPEYTSTAEIVFKLFFEKGKKLNSEICETILVGILGDTGSFKYINSTQVGVFDVAKKLVSDGNINIENLQFKYQSIHKNVYELFAELVKNSQFEEIKNWPPFIYTFLDEKSLSVRNSTSNEISDASHLFTNYLKSIKGYEWGFILTPRENLSYWSFSCRSVPGSVNVRLVGEAFGGGGHNRAGGGKIDNLKTHKEAFSKIFDWMGKNKPTIE